MGVHHDYPNDASRLVMPPSVSVPLAVGFFGFFVLIFAGAAPAVWAGLICGYLAYDMIHYATHHFSMKNPLGAWLKQYHPRHHYKDDHSGYGVSTPIWDYVFRTTRK
ncbi:MAG: sterol desaturase family protein [Spartobacteria bacterium]